MSPYQSSRLELEKLMTTVAERNASDLHLTVGRPPTLRIDGELLPIEDQPVLTPEHTEKLCLSMLNEDKSKIFAKFRDVDFSLTFQDKARFRANVYQQKGYYAAALRLIPTEIKTLEQLGLPLSMEQFTEHSQGFVLVTGPTGHGKSTSIASMVNIINHRRADHIITIEDPVEYVFTQDKAMIEQREIGQDAVSFPRALRAALREDPDVVMVGEMRDLETTATAITVAETGHLVFSTLHTNSSAQSIDRMIDIFPSHQQGQIRAQLANILLGVVAQRLIPRIGGGRVVVAEILIATPAVRNLIREGKTYQLDSVIQTSAESGMVSMDRSLAELAKTGEVSMEDAMNYAMDPAGFKSMMREGR